MSLKPVQVKTTVAVQTVDWSAGPLSSVTPRAGFATVTVTRLEVVAAPLLSVAIALKV